MSMLDDNTHLKELCTTIRVDLPNRHELVVPTSSWEERCFRMASEMFEAAMLKTVPPGTTNIPDGDIEKTLANKAKACIGLAKIFINEYRGELNKERYAR